jgi:hypothetical protein
MNQDNNDNMLLANVDVPTYQYPSVVYIQELLNKIQSTTESKENSLLKVLDYVIIELEIAKSAYSCHEKELFIKLKVTLEVLMNSYALQKKSIDNISTCLTLLSFLSHDRKNLDLLPIEFQDSETSTSHEEDMKYRSSYDGYLNQRIRAKFKNSDLTCPSCDNKFPQFRYDVARTPFSLTCPMCHYSFPNE